MPETPPPEGFSLDLIGHMLQTMQQEMREMREGQEAARNDVAYLSGRFSQVEYELRQVKSHTVELKERFTRFEAAQFRFEERQKAIETGIEQAIGHLRTEEAEQPR